jgi:hypothetical protein
MATDFRSAGKNTYGFSLTTLFVLLFVYKKKNEQFSSYLAAVTITGDRAAKFRPMLGTQGL